MLKESELRIGNYLWNKDEDQLEVLEGVRDAGDVFTDQRPEPIYIEEFEPIPLTEDWLERFGFEYWCDDSWSISVRKNTKGEEVVKLVIDLNGSYASIRHKMSDFSFKGDLEAKVRSVHQLQNLYHALTGEEITLKNDQSC